MAKKKQTIDMSSYHVGLYGPNTPLALIEFIEQELGLPDEYLGFHRQSKLTIQYGNPLSGKAWIDKPVVGFIELHPDNAAQLILKKYQGRKAYDVVLINNIVRISAGSTVHYRHPLFHTHADTPPVVEESQDSGRALRRISIDRNASNSQATTEHQE